MHQKLLHLGCPYNPSESLYLHQGPHEMQPSQHDGISCCASVSTLDLANLQRRKRVGGRPLCDCDLLQGRRPPVATERKGLADVARARVVRKGGT